MIIISYIISNILRVPSIYINSLALLSPNYITPLHTKYRVHTVYTKAILVISLLLLGFATCWVYSSISLLDKFVFIS